MSDIKTAKPQQEPQDEPHGQDVEGNMLIGGSMSSDVARIRSREIEREAREHAKAKEAKDSGDR